MSTAWVITDLFMGDSSKGAWTDWLCANNNVGLVVKHTGGSQCSHHVVKNGRVYEFAQVGSGHLRGVPTHLGPKFLFNPLNLANEFAAVGEAVITVDERAPIVTPYQRWAGVLRETKRGDGMHGSCGQGIGETAADAIREPEMVVRAGDLSDPKTLLEKLRFWRESKRALAGFCDRVAGIDTRVCEPQSLPLLLNAYADCLGRFNVVHKDWASEELKNLEKQGRDVVFEGAQGVLLDEWFGLHPHTTWSTTTHENALEMLEEAGWEEEIDRVGLVRAYGTRHGAGPFPTERDDLDLPEPPDQNGKPEEMAGKFRVGDFDATLVRYAIDVCGGIDTLAISHLDVAAKAGVNIQRGYRIPGYPDVNKLLVGTKADLNRQEALTKCLFSATPVFYNRLHGTRGDALRIASAVGHFGSILTAHGPSAEDRVRYR